ncbi:MAG: hypothetical protein RL637_1630 [Pseudomonadota bacterium]|jgi:hypothetical protein
MLTHCSHCKKIFNIGVEQLSHHQGVLYCPHCDEMLTRLKFFNPDIFTHHQPKVSQWQWGLGTFLCLILFAGQLYYLKADDWLNHPDYRPYLEQICQLLLCKLPTYQQLDDFEVLQGNLQLTDDNHYLFSVVISNQAEFPQAYPDIQLNFLDFNGQIFAQRIFYPKDYQHLEPSATIPASESIEISLAIAAPKQKMGGYTFELR